MSLFNIKKKSEPAPIASAVFGPTTQNNISNTNNIGEDVSRLANLVFNVIKDGIIVVDQKRTVKLMNPAAARMLGSLDENFALGLDLELYFKLETEDGSAVETNANPVWQAIATGKEYVSREYILSPKDNPKKYRIEVRVIPTKNQVGDYILSFRNIDKEITEEKEQSEFISTASHEMRTPVASIEGYLGLALNPQTATIDERARKYLESARSSSQHLGKLFQDLLNVTKLDDKKIKPRFVPINLTEYIEKISNEYMNSFREKQINYVFGGGKSKTGMRSLEQVIYSYVDLNFLHEIITNLIENAIKYSPQGGSISINVVGEPERGIISVSDTGIGIPSEDIQHIFQKFYRVDNRQTREINGTGLGLYLVKQRTEAMNGTVWVESMFGKGSTFFVGLPRISEAEYEKRRIAIANELQAAKIQREQHLNQVMSQLATSQPGIQVQTQNGSFAAPMPPSTPVAPITTAQPTASAQSAAPIAPVPPTAPVPPAAPGVFPTPPATQNNTQNNQ